MSELTTRRYPRTLYGVDAAFPGAPQYAHAVEGYRMPLMARLIRIFWR